MQSASATIFESMNNVSTTYVLLPSTDGDDDADDDDKYLTSVKQFERNTEVAIIERINRKRLNEPTSVAFGPIS